jgi:alpha-acetolactate decarboxylase
MKNIFLLIALVVTPMVTNSQSFFDTLEDTEGVDMVVVTKDAFELISKFKNVKIDDNEGMKVFKMIQDLKEFKMFSTNKVSVADKMESMVNSAIKTQNLTQLMRIKENDSRIKIYVKASKNKDYVSEVLMYIRGISKQTNQASEAVIVSLTGNIDINKMSELADTFVKEGNKK